MKHFVASFLVLVFVLFCSLPATATVENEGAGEPQGYKILIKGKSGWTARETVHFSMNFEEKVLDVTRFLPDVDGEYKIRVQHGPEGMANLDSLFLNSNGKIMKPEKVFEVGKQASLIKKLGKSDFDVINAHGKTIEVHFANPGTSPKALRFSLKGREENPNKIPGGPCAYPSSLHPKGDNSNFYDYSINQNYGSINIDGLLKPEDKLGKPLFKSFTKPISGHPDGYLYTYLKNDENYLYGAIDFTSDNTFDGSADFSAILVKTPKGVKRFKVSVGETKWGKPGFMYTDKVAYQHKVYEFKIPLDELGILKPEEKPLQLAFLAYGTTACTANISIGSEGTPPGTQFLGDSNLTQVMLQVDFVNTQANVAWVGSITVTGEGTGDEVNDLTDVKAYNDENNDGTLDPGDSLLATSTFGADDGTALLTIAPDDGLSVTNGQETNALIVYEVKSTTASDSTFKAKIVNNGDVTQNANNIPACNSFTVIGAPVDGGFLTIEYGSSTSAAGANNPAAGNVAPGETNVPMVQIALSADADEALDLDSVTITDAGGGSNASLISAVRLWEDADGDGTVTAGDTQLNNDQTFTDGTNTLTLATDAAASQIAAGTTMNYLVTYNFASATASKLNPEMNLRQYGKLLAQTIILPWATPFILSGCGGEVGSINPGTGGTFQTSVAAAADVILTGATSGRTINPASVSVTGGEKTLVNP